MTTQILYKTNQVAVLEECGSWIDRLLARAAAAIASISRARAQAVQLKQLARLDQRQLRDIGLDDPAAQLRLFDARIEAGSDNLAELRDRLQARR